MINANVVRCENLIKAIFGNSFNVHVAGPYSISSVLEDVVDTFQYHRLHSIRGYHRARPAVSRASSRLSETSWRTSSTRSMSAMT